MPIPLPLPLPAARAGATRLTLTGRMVGQMADGWPEAVEGVWRHFLFEGLQPYLAAGRHLKD